jgi:hypothetical protein
MCTNKAKVFYEALGLIGTLSASSGRLIKFMQRRGTNKLALQTEQLHASANTGDVFYKEFQKFIEENLQPDQIHNADQIGLHLKGTLTLVNKNSAPGESV